MKKALLMCAILMAIPACQVYTPEQEKAIRLNSLRNQIGDPKAPEAFAWAWEDGCSSGYSAAGLIRYRPKKDVQKYLTDPMYVQAWKDGFERCKAIKESSDRMLGPVFR